MSSLSANMISAEIGGQTTPNDKLKQGELLFNGFTELFKAHAVLADIHRGFGSDQKLRILCFQLTEHPALVAAVKATAETQNDYLDQALFCSWLSFLIADQLKLSVSATKDLFIAGLIQDIAASGGAHLKELSAIFSEEAGALNNEINVDKHPVVTGRYLETIPRLSSEIKTIVRAHHERFDGAGFPDGKVESQLTTTQQILIVSNEVRELCNRDSNKPYDFASILPILNLNASVYFRPVFCALICVISPSIVGSVQYHTLTITSVLDYQRQLMMRWPHVLKSSAELTLLDESATVITMKQIAKRAWMLVTTAGILSEDLSQWLSQLEQSNEGHAEEALVLELNVLLGELNEMITSYQEHSEMLTNDLRIEMSETQRALLIDLSYSMGEPLDTFDLDEFTILNMCD